MADFLLTGEIPEPGMTMLRDAGSVELLRDADPDALARACASGEHRVVVATVSDRFGAELLARASIVGVSNFGVGVDNIDVPAAERAGILVGNTPDVLTDATADVAMLLLLAVARRAVEADRLVRDGGFTGWNPGWMLGSDVSGARLGLAGFGRIGKAVARRALGFGMEVAFCPRPPGDRAVGDGELGDLAGRVTHLTWAELVPWSDFLSLHVPKSEGTHHLVDAGVLARMKPTAYLVNTARGTVVDETALVTALRDGVIAGAGLDVYEHEPALAPGLAELPNTVLLPHIGSATGSVRGEMARLCAANAIAMLRGEPLPAPVSASAQRPR